MRPRIFLSLVCGLLTSHLLLADVTMRSKMDYKLGSFVPAAAAEQMNKQMGDMLANGIVLRIKGTRSMTSSGPLTVVSDREKGTITLVDPKGKRYANATLSDYADKLKAAIPQIPDAAKQMFENMKFDVKTDKTGKTDVIKGIKAEEMLIHLSMDMPGPMAGAMAMKMEMHMWAATKEELERVPALKELAAYLSAQAAGADPSSVANKIFAGIPGVGDKLKAPMDAMMKASSQAILRTEIKMVMPGSAKMMGATNPEEPFTDMTTDLVELSTNPIPDSVFQVPAGFQEAKLEELVGMLAPGRPQAPQQDPVPPEELAAARVGGYPAGVTAPVLVRKFEAEYTEEARRAKYHAVVILAATVNPQGVPENIRVRRAVGLGLDEKAIEAVKLWQFRPAVKEGIPVAMDVTIEVAFHE